MSPVLILQGKVLGLIRDREVCWAKDITNDTGCVYLNDFSSIKLLKPAQVGGENLPKLLLLLPLLLIPIVTLWLCSSDKTINSLIMAAVCWQMQTKEIFVGDGKFKSPLLVGFGFVQLDFKHWFFFPHSTFFTFPNRSLLIVTVISTLLNHPIRVPEGSDQSTINRFPVATVGVHF